MNEKGIVIGIIFLIVIGIICFFVWIRNERERIVAVYDTGQRHRYRGFLMATIAIHYDDGTVKYDTVEFGSFEYNNYMEWNKNHPRDKEE